MASPLLPGVPNPSNPLPPLSNFFSVRAAATALLFILLSSRRAYVLTGNYVDGLLQMILHGMLLYYLLVWIQPFLPQPPPAKFGPLYR